MAWIDLIAAVALMQFVFFGMLVGRARARYGVKAPAVTGHDMFERLYRVQVNTLELLVVLVPALYLAAKYWRPDAVAAAGALYVVGRFVYLRAYTRDPNSRSLGFGLSAFPIFALVLATLVGVLLSFQK